MTPVSIATVIIPAHNEVHSIARLLRMLDAKKHSLFVVVVCNGCTDDTAEVAQKVGGPAVRVLDIPAPSKATALRAGDAVATPGLPRVYLDADVVISGQGLVRLVEAMGKRGLLAASPARVLDTTGADCVVRAHTNVWSQLPNVQTGLFGRGVIAVSDRGYLDRIAPLPDRMADDLRFSEAFHASERGIVDEAQVTVITPRTTRALLKRRVRVVTGNAQLDDHGERSTEARTTLRSLLRIARSGGPSRWVDVTVFLLVGVVSNLLARRALHEHDFVTWQRDDSSRPPSRAQL